MRTRLGPAVAAEALTRLHTAFDQDTEPTSGPFIAVSGRHFNGCSRAKNRGRSRGSLVMGGGGAEARPCFPIPRLLLTQDLTNMYDTVGLPFWGGRG